MIIFNSFPLTFSLHEAVLAFGAVQALRIRSVVRSESTPLLPDWSKLVKLLNVDPSGVLRGPVTKSSPAKHDASLLLLELRASVC